MLNTTRNHGNSPGETANDVDVVNTVNTPPGQSQKRKGHSPWLLGGISAVLLLGVLGGVLNRGERVEVIASKPSTVTTRPVVTAVPLPASPAADVGDAYNDGVASAVCQLLASGMDGEGVVREMKTSFGGFAISVGQDLTDDQWRAYVRQAVATKCPEQSAKV